jgi:uncharacterized membrane protein YeiB
MSTQLWVSGGTSSRSFLALLSGASAHSGTTFEIVGSTGVALAVIAVCLVIADRLRTVVLPLAAVGSMALTVYIGSVLAVWVTPDLEYRDNVPWLIYVCGALAFCTAWRLVMGRGPVERLLTWSSALAAGAADPQRLDSRPSS